MKENCCGVKTVNPKPAKFSMEYAYGGYRREVKKGILQKEGLI